MRDEWREIIAAAIEREADEILDEVNSDPSLKDVQAPEEIHDKLFEQIREYEKQKIYDQLTEEDRELIQLGKVYKKKRTIGRYVVVALAVVAVLALGSVSMGEGESIPEVISRIFAGREQEVIDFGEESLFTYNEEGEVFEKIEKTFGILPVKLAYLPENTVFYEGTFSADMQSANLIYEIQNQSSIIYVIWPDYRKGTIGTDVEDKKIKEYLIQVDDVDVNVKQYVVEETGNYKWSVRFIYNDVLYFLRITNMEQDEVEKIVNNLHFFKQGKAKEMEK